MAKAAAVILVRTCDVQLNILAPATTQHHIMAGGELKLNQDRSLELAAMYAPKSTVSGAEIHPGRGHLVDIATRQYGVTLGVKYFFDTTTTHLRSRWSNAEKRLFRVNEGIALSKASN